MEALFKYTLSWQQHGIDPGEHTHAHTQRHRAVQVKTQEIVLLEVDYGGVSLSAWCVCVGQANKGSMFYDKWNEPSEKLPSSIPHHTRWHWSWSTHTHTCVCTSSHFITNCPFPMTVTLMNSTHTRAVHIHDNDSNHIVLCWVEPTVTLTLEPARNSAGVLS